MKRFSDRAEGIVISGAPGSGKSTLASGLANFYQIKEKLLKHLNLHVICKLILELLNIEN